MPPSFSVLDAFRLAGYGLAEMTKAPRIPPNPIVVEILAFPDVQLLDVTGPLQVFATANAHRRDAGKEPAYAIRVVARSRNVTSSAGLAFSAEPLPTPNEPLHTLIVAGGDSVHAAARDPRLVAWLAARSNSAKRVASVCTGAFLLAAAGLLEGRCAATHWASCERLARQFPSAKVEPDPIFVRDGALWTSAGVTAGIDMALAMVEEDIGHAAAMAVARDLVVFLKRPGGQAQFSAALSLQGDRRFDELNGWIAGHLRQDLSVPALAARAGMSERSFLRRYREATGQTPARAVEKLRVEAARRLLVEGPEPVKRVAARSGFGSEETMRRAFLREVGVSPNDYRERFSAQPSPAGRAIP